MHRGQSESVGLAQQYLRIDTWILKNPCEKSCTVMHPPSRSELPGSANPCQMSPSITSLGCSRLYLMQELSSDCVVRGTNEECFCCLDHPAVLHQESGICVLSLISRLKQVKSRLPYSSLRAGHGGSGPHEVGTVGQVPRMLYADFRSSSFVADLRHLASSAYAVMAPHSGHEMP